MRTQINFLRYFAPFSSNPQLLSFDGINRESREELYRSLDIRHSRKEKGVQVQEIVIDDTQQKLEELTRSFREMQRDLNIIKCLLQSML